MKGRPLSRPRTAASAESSALWIAMTEKSVPTSPRPRETARPSTSSRAIRVSCALADG